MDFSWIKDRKNTLTTKTFESVAVCPSHYDP